MSGLLFSSLNCRGLASFAKQRMLSQFCLQFDLDFIFLQEINVSSISLARSIEAYFGASKAFWSFSSHKCTGCAIFIFSNDVSYSKFEYDLDGRLIFVDVDIRGLMLRLINIYAPSKEADRRAFLQSLYTNFNTSRQLILGGDFNCIMNSKLDKIGGNPMNGFIGTDEVFSLCQDFSLVDCFRTFYPNAVLTTWHSKSVHSRLDRFYVSKSLLCNVRECSIHPSPSTLSDHDLIVIKLVPENSIQLGRGYWKCNNSIVLDSNFVKAFYNFWGKKMSGFVLTLDSWDVLKSEIKNFIIAFSKRKSKVSNAVLNSLKRRYSLLQKTSFASNNPQDYGDQINIIRDQISLLQNKALFGVMIRSRCDFLNDSEKPSRYHFIKERKRSEKKVIRNLVSEGKTLSDNDSISDAFRNFYSELFSDEAIDLDLMDDFLSDLPQLSSFDADLCDGPIQYEEILLALKGMKCNKSPGSDGLSKEFYLKFFDLFAPLFVSLYSLIFDVGILTKSQRLSYISLLCKDPNNSENMKNWRPISLLNVDYKILSKVLTTRLGNVMASIIHPNQTSGIKGRSIVDNLHLLRNIFDYVSQKDIPCAWINLDFLKAFDRCSHRYLFEAISGYGFNESFQKWVRILYNNVSSSVIVNNHVSEPFAYSRGVRQGCSISPLLFVLCLEPMAIKIRKEESIKGLALPGRPVSVKDVMFADDVTGVVTSGRGMDSFMHIVDRFCFASGFLLNFIKTKGFFLGKWRSRSDHPFGISWPERVKLLGCLFGYTVSGDDIWGPILKKFQKVLNFSKLSGLTLKQKSIIISTFACSKIWYTGSIYIMPKVYIDQFQASIYKFLWPTAHYEPISRAVQILPFLNGGLSVVNVKLKLCALYIMHLCRYISNPNLSWGCFTNYWCALHFRKFNIDLWSNSCPHSMDPSGFYSHAVAVFDLFVKRFPNFVISNPSVKSLYNTLLGSVSKPPRCISLFSSVNFKSVFSNLHDRFIDPSARDVCYRLIMQVLPVRHTMAVILGERFRGSKSCSFGCGFQHETYEHIFYDCNMVFPLRNLLKSFVSNFGKSLNFQMVYLLNCVDENKFRKSVLLYLYSEFIRTIWIHRNFAKYEKNRLVTSNTLILSYVSRINFRIKCDFHRFSRSLFIKYWCSNPLFCVIDEEGGLNLKLKTS
jgi:exonuclease III